MRPDIYFVAYKNLYANNGAATKGVNEDTADGFSEAKIDSIIKALADETYQPMPVRRTYIQKKNNRKKLRPLGIPTFTDKLVQEVLRMILEAVYEPTTTHYHADSKALRKERQKKIAQGHAEDDHEEEQTWQQTM